MISTDLRVRHAASTVAAGGVIACAAEAVWGLSCDPWNEQAVERLLSLKQRRPEKGLILAADRIERFADLLQDLPEDQLRRIEQSWPGPVTWLVPHCNRIPEWVSGAFDTVAIRVSAHPALAQVCAELGRPMVTTSANPAGAQPARELFQVRRYFAEALDYYAPGRVGQQRRPTEIRDLGSDAIIRNA